MDCPVNGVFATISRPMSRSSGRIIGEEMPLSGAFLGFRGDR
jgi:hypothetical protein